jgi:hypothetical protein
MSGLRQVHIVVADDADGIRDRSSPMGRYGDYPLSQAALAHEIQ